jgi:hypothetical protein
MYTDVAVKTYQHHLGKDPVGDGVPRVALGSANHSKCP